MMLSTRSRYGLRLMIELAVRSDTCRPVLLKDIAASQEISEKYLSKLVIPLKSRGLVVSARGAKGGYNLARKAGDINVYEIVQALEGDILSGDGGENEGSPSKNVGRASGELWRELDEVIHDFLTSKTLDILAGLERDARSTGMYYI